MGRRSDLPNLFSLNDGASGKAWNVEKITMMMVKKGKLSCLIVFARLLSNLMVFTFLSR